MNGPTAGERVRPRLRGMLIGVLFFVVLLATAASGFILIEGYSPGEAFYMAVITVSTVGFGEVHPLSPSGRLFTALIILSSLGGVIYLSARVGQWILAGELGGVLARRRMKKRLAALNHHVIVCGFGRVGRPAVEGLLGAGRQLCVIDSDPRVSAEHGSGHCLFVTGDCTDEEALTEAGIERAEVLLALLPSDADNLYVTMTAKGCKPSLRVIARASDGKARSQLIRGGADRVISVYEIASSRVLQAALRPTVVDFMELVTHREQLALCFEEVRVGEVSEFAGRSIAEVGIRQNYSVIIVAIKRTGGGMEFNPSASTQLEEGDTLVALGPAEHLERLRQAAAGGK